MILFKVFLYIENIMILVFCGLEYNKEKMIDSIIDKKVTSIKLLV